MSTQDKAKEVAVFDRHAASDDYHVFTAEAKAHIIDAVVRFGELKPGARVADLGCGSGVFTVLLRDRGLVPVGLDISPKLIALTRRKFAGIEFLEGDAENLPFPDVGLHAVLLSDLTHHFPNPRWLAGGNRTACPRNGGRF